MNSGRTTREEPLAPPAGVDAYVRRLHVRAWGLAAGMLSGLGLFVATNLLVLRGGDDVGTHLGLLSIYFPFYDVTFLGSLIGFVYAFVVGYVAAALVCAVYNRAVRS